MNLSSCQIKEIKSHLYLPALKIKDAPMHSMDRFPIHCSGMKGFVKLAADVPFFAVLTADDTRRRESRRVVEYETDTERERRGGPGGGGAEGKQPKNNMSKKVINDKEAKTTKARVTAAAMEFVEAAVLSYEAGGAAGTMRYGRTDGLLL